VLSFSFEVGMCQGRVTLPCKSLRGVRAPNNLPGPGVEDCSGNLPGLGVEDCSEVGDSLGLPVVDCSEVGDSPGLGVEDCSALGDSQGEQVRFEMAQEHWPAEDFGQQGQPSAHLLQYSTGTEVMQ